MKSFFSLLLTVFTLVSASCERSSQSVDTPPCDPAKTKCAANALQSSDSSSSGFSTDGGFSTDSSGYSSDSSGYSSDSSGYSSGYSSGFSGGYSSGFSGGYSSGFGWSSDSSGWSSGGWSSSSGWSSGGWSSSSGWSSGGWNSSDGSGWSSSGNGWTPNGTSDGGSIPTATPTPFGFTPTPTPFGFTPTPTPDSNDPNPSFEPGPNQLPHQTISPGQTPDPNFVNETLGVSVRVENGATLKVSVPTASAKRFSQLNYRFNKDQLALTRTNTGNGNKKDSNGFYDIGFLEMEVSLNFKFDGRDCKGDVVVAFSSTNKIPMNTTCRRN